ncbi:ScyD/ScyE family protein [Mastigocladopsis repens]|uniref:ScyD/ScyE family protein n=1 Tax=Mastigocladopsis repens TaxID=221287 RepID=UPI000475229C|nr:ScyD/ScyE family protein [Mastigocladopsis repens]
MKFKSFALTLFTLCVTATCGTEAAKAATMSVVADGLDNPRGIAFDSDGTIYVAESGKGGDGNGGVNCIPSPSAQYIPLCSGSTGAVTKITTDGTQESVITDLTSLALTPSGEQAAGPADIKFDSSGNAYLLTGLAGDPNNRDTVLGTPDLGQLYKVDLNTGSLTSIADFAAYEAQNNPDGSDVINNPYTMTIVGDTAYVIDGGGNSIYTVGLDGSGIQNVAAFPQGTLSSDAEYPPGVEGSTGFAPTVQSVPTDITVAPDGSLTVVEYTAFPYEEGTARIFSVDPDTLEMEVVADGFTQLTGAAYDSEGNLYVLQHMNQSEWKGIEQGGNIIGDISGSVIKIATDGTRETIWSGDGLEAASELTFGPDGNLYISNRSRLAGEGQILKLDLESGGATKVPEPASVIGLIMASAVGAKAMKRKRQQQLLAKVETL